MFKWVVVIALIASGCGSDTPSNDDVGQDFADTSNRTDMGEADVATDGQSDATGSTDASDDSDASIGFDASDAADMADVYDGPRRSDCGLLPHDTLICDGFEGELNGRAVGTSSIEQVGALGGERFMRATRTPGGIADGFGVDGVRFTFDSANVGTSMHVRWFQRQPALPDTLDSRFSTVRVRKPTEIIDFRTTGDETRVVSFGDGSQPVRLSGDAFPSDVWVCVELDITFGDGDADIALSLDGVPVLSASNQIYLNGYNEVVLGLVAFDDATPSVDYDELIVTSGEQLRTAGLTSIGCDAP